MRNTLRRGQKGQAIVMVTLSLIAMCGVLGLAVDLGWSYFLRRTAQKSADAGALAAAQQFLLVNGPASSYPTNTSLNSACPSGITTVTTNLDSGCIYMRGATLGTGAWYGFVDGSNGGRTQHARLDSTTDPAVMTGQLNLPVNALYAVRARAWEEVPQLFSALMGNPTATVAARATGAIVQVPWHFGLWGLARGCPPTNPPIGCSPDPLPNIPNGVSGTINANPPSQMGAGSDIYMQGSNSALDFGTQAISLASQSANSGSFPGPPAADSGGGSSPNVTVGATVYNSPSGGSVTGAVTSPYDNPTPHADFAGFEDPMASKISPPVPQGTLPNCPIPVNTDLNGKYLSPGIYYAVDSSGAPLARAIDFSGNVNFTSAPPTGATCYSSTAPSGGSGFAQYVIFGGVNGKGQNTTYSFASGEYVLAGAVASGGTAQPVFALTSNAGAVTTGSTGSAFILTDGNYPGLTSLLTRAGNPLATNATVRNQFDQGFTYVQGGSGAIQLNGIDPTSASAANSHLDQYGQLLFWQDRRNALIKYFDEQPYPTLDPTYDGHVNCGGVRGDFMANSTCQSTPAQLDANGVDPSKSSPSMTLQGSPSMTLNGLLYQPRGSIMQIQGSGSNNAPLTGRLQLISGGYYLAGRASILSPNGPTNVLMHTIATLVQ